MRLMGLPTRETNSCHASSSPGPAQRQTTSFSDKDEYRVILGVFDIVFVIADHDRTDYRLDSRGRLTHKTAQPHFQLSPNLSTTRNALFLVRVSRKISSSSTGMPSPSDELSKCQMAVCPPFELLIHTDSISLSRPGADLFSPYLRS